MTLSWQWEFSFDPEKDVAGVDEVGYGALAGPVIVAAVILSPHRIPGKFLEQIDDSKRLSPKRRLKICREFMDRPDFGRWAIGRVEVSAIHSGTVLNCTLHAMVHAVKACGARAVLIDGRNPLPCDLPQKAIVEGDRQSFSIALASIIAKVMRDEEMSELAKAYPAFQWEKNKGYGTLDHRKALRQWGLTPHHRLNYCQKTLKEAWALQDSNL